MDGDFFRHPPDYQAFSRRIYQIKEAFPCVNGFTIGKSALGRGIFALSPGPLQGATLLVGGVHGSEWITVLLLMRFCEDLFESIQDGGKIAGIDVAKTMAGKPVVIIPCLNPDGTEIAIHGSKAALSLKESVEEMWKSAPDAAWQANARGVDLNHNFDAGWDTLKKMEVDSGILSPGPTRYGGTRPHSEPETQAVTRFCQDFKIRQVYAYHAQGEEIYYKYGEHTPPHSALVAELLSHSSGYQVCAPTGLASHGGLKDWFIDTFSRPGFTIEIGKGKNPLPASDLEAIYPKVQEMLLLSLLV